MSYFWIAKLRLCQMCDRAPPVSSRSNEQRAATALAVSPFENLLLK